MRVLVTGGAGFIGSHLTDAYLRRGDEVVIVDNFSTGRRENVPAGAEAIEGDIRESDLVERLASRGFDLLSHHAAQMDVRRSVADPAYDADVNLVGAIRLVDALVRNGLRRIIFASSGGAIYGEPVWVPQAEDHPTLPVSPYGCAKLSFEHYLHYYRVAHDVRSVSLRYANVYGPRQSEHGEAGVVAIFAGRLLSGDRIVINGSGCQTRDFVHVEDVVDANIAVSERELEGVFNVGTGIETSVNELAKTMREVAGSSSAIEHGPPKAGEQMRSVIDPSRLRKAFSLPPPKAVEQGLKETIDWFRETTSR